jgi:hypothetical protein
MIAHQTAYSRQPRKFQLYQRQIGDVWANEREEFGHAMSKRLVESLLRLLPYLEGFLKPCSHALCD